MKIYGDFRTRFDTVENIIAVIESSIAMKKPVTFSIEGDWGRGKTWIVDRVADTLMGIKTGDRSLSCKFYSIVFPSKLCYN